MVWLRVGGADLKRGTRGEAKQSLTSFNRKTPVIFCASVWDCIAGFQFIYGYQLISFAKYFAKGGLWLASRLPVNLVSKCLPCRSASWLRLFDELNNVNKELATPGGETLSYGTPVESVKTGAEERFGKPDLYWLPTSFQPCVRPSQGCFFI